MERKDAGIETGRRGRAPAVVSAEEDPAGLAALRRMMADQPLWSRALGTIAMVAALVLAIVFLRHLLTHVRLSEVGAVFGALPRTALLLSLAATAGSYVALTFYDFLALRVLGWRLRWRDVAAAAFSAYSLSHNLGLGVLTGGSARYRVYARSGLKAADIARVLALNGLTLTLGVLGIAGIALIRNAGTLGAGGLPMPVWAGRLIGGLVLAGLVAAIALPHRPDRTLRWRGWTMPLPDRRYLALQLAVAVADLACASLSLFALVPHLALGAYPAFLLAYVLALVLGMASHVPGGLGVFEAVMLAALPGVAPAELVAALLAYRVVYYLLPLLLGGGLFLTLEARAARRGRSAG